PDASSFAGQCRAGRRSRVLLVRPFGAVPSGRASRPVSRASKAHRGFPLSAALCAPHPVRQGGAWSSAFTLATPFGKKRPTGGILQAQGTAGMDDRGAIRGVAPDVGGARTALWHCRAWSAHPDRNAGDHALGPAALFAACLSQVIRPA